jgi:hypothetical protein
MKTPWAVLLCKFNDDDSEPFERQFYEEVFTTAGAGKWNMVDYFRDVSHGRLDLSGSRVFGWYTLDKSSADYVGSGANQKGREDLVNWARQAAKAGQQEPVHVDPVDLSAFYGVVICMNVQTDLFGGEGQVDVSGDSRVVCDPVVDEDGVCSMSPSLLGQEMGHGYGLQHSREDGSTRDYRDSWDVMSTKGPYMAQHPVYNRPPFLDRFGRRIMRIGPLLNAANMASRGWLDESRVWRAGDTEHGTSVELRPLVRRDLPGYLAARVGPYLIEFRTKEGWDAQIPRAAVLIHEFYDNNSYIMHVQRSSAEGLKKVYDLVEGHRFEAGDPDNPVSTDSGLSIEVDEIDAEGRTATINVKTRRGFRPRVGPARILVGVRHGGEGLIIIGGKIVPVPPRSPLYRILEQVAELQESESVRSAPARDIMRREALTSIASQVGAQLQRTHSYRVPNKILPPQDTHEGEHTDGGTTTGKRTRSKAKKSPKRGRAAKGKGNK